MLSKILIIDEKLDIRKDILNELSKQYILFDCSDNISKIKEKIEEIEYVLLIVFLAYGEHRMVSRIRNMCNIPIMVILANYDFMNAEAYLKAGADECVSKDVNCRLCVTKINSLIRRYTKYNRTSESEIIEYLDFVLNSLHKSVEIKGEKINLTATEYKILYYLSKNRGIVLSRGQIYENVWKDLYLMECDPLDAHMCNIRKKLKDNARKPKYIVNVKGLGFRFGE